MELAVTLSSSSPSPRNKATISPSRPALSSPRTPKPPGIRTRFLRNTPMASHALPPGSPLNFTMAEMIVLLPHLYKERSIACRFLNNQISTAVHFAILVAHRDLGLADAAETQAREVITEGYRKTMRALDPSWRKATHAPPRGWDAASIAVGGFVPGAAREKGYVAPPPVRFRELARGLKKLPRGADAGDLTRALEFALKQTKFDGEGKPVEYVFPDDIHAILGVVGRVVVTPEHTDAAVVRRYAGARDINRKLSATPPSGAVRETVPQEVGSWQAVMDRGLSLPGAKQNTCGGFAPAGHFPAVLAAARVVHEQDKFAKVPHYPSGVVNTPADSHAPSVHPAELYDVDRLFHLPLWIRQQMAPPGQDNGMYGVEYTMDELLKPHLALDQPKTVICRPESGLLRDIPEAVLDDSDFSRAVRFAKQSDQIATDWNIDEVDVLSELLEFGGWVEDGWLDLDALE